MLTGNITPSDFVGEEMDESIGDEITRIYAQNLNGLGWDNTGGRWPHICETMEAIQADIACFSELNVDTHNYRVRRKMESICHNHFQQNALIMSSSKHNTTTTYKPGGTAILARNQITANIKNHTRDRMGRWASVSLTTATTRRIRIISAYQACRICALEPTRSQCNKWHK